MMRGGRIGFGPSSVLERGELSALQGEKNSPAIKYGFITTLPRREKEGERDRHRERERGRKTNKEIG